MGPRRLIRLFYRKGKKHNWIIGVLGILRSLLVLWVPQLQLVTEGSHQRMECGVLLVGRCHLWEYPQGRLVLPRAGWW